MKRTVAVIQARTGSNRLPRKILEPLFDDVSLLAYQCRHLRNIPGVDELVIATTTHPNDDTVEQLGQTEGIRVIRGSEHDVLDRFLVVAERTLATTLVRITSDSPFRDPMIIARCVADHHDNLSEYTRPVDKHLPRGLRAEVVEMRVLQHLAADPEVTARHREHVTLFIREHYEAFRTHMVRFADTLHYPDYDFSVDTREDLDFVRSVYAQMSERDWPIDAEHICKLISEQVAEQNRLEDIA